LSGTTNTFGEVAQPVSLRRLGDEHGNDEVLASTPDLHLADGKEREIAVDLEKLIKDTAIRTPRSGHRDHRDHPLPPQEISAPR
jgi:hypothetical protein